MEKISKLSLVLCYYDQPLMLAEQKRVWNGYPEYVKNKMEIVLVDDASPRFPLGPDYVNDYGIPTRIFRLKEDIPWNQNAARNIGAKEAAGPWLLMGGLDHVNPMGLMIVLLAMNPDRLCYYTFPRKQLPGEIDIRPAKDIYLIRKDMYWKVGGYNEMLSGMYGLDKEYHARLVEYAKKITLQEGFTLAYTVDEIADASVTWLNRNVDASRRYLNALKSSGKLKLKVLTNKYEEVKFGVPEPEKKDAEDDYITSE